MSPIGREEFIQFEKRYQSDMTHMVKSIDSMSQSLSEYASQGNEQLKQTGRITNSLDKLTSQLSVQINDQSTEIRDIRNILDEKNKTLSSVQSSVRTLEEERETRKKDAAHGKWAFYGWLLTIAGYIVKNIIDRIM
jgi:phage host-nuclease inhibitor protein Gam